MTIFLRLRCKILSLEIYKELLDLSDPRQKISVPCIPCVVHAQTKQIPSDFKDKKILEKKRSYCTISYSSRITDTR